MRNGHLHNSRYLGYEDTGTIDLSPLLLGGKAGLPEEAIRFRKIDLCINCACCLEAWKIASVTMRVKGRKPLVEQQTERKEPKTRAALMSMFAKVEIVAKRIADREVFNGYSVDDVVELAKCFRNDDEV